MVFDSVTREPRIQDLKRLRYLRPVKLAQLSLSPLEGLRLLGCESKSGGLGQGRNRLDRSGLEIRNEAHGGKVRRR